MSVGKNGFEKTKHNFPYKWTLKDAVFTKDKGKVFSCFACGGGSSFGYKLAGFDVLGCNEIDPKMIEAYKANHNPKYAYLEPIQTFKLRTDLPDELYQLDILDGSPPCSSFSMAGNREKDWGKEKKFREGQAMQVLDTLFFDFIDLAKKLQPKVVIAENVKGMIQGNAKGYCKLVMARLKEIGYRPQLFLLNAADCGVAQRRERVFFCAVREDVSDKKLILSPQHKWISAGEAVSDLQVLTKEEIEDTKPAANDLKCWIGTKKDESYRDFLLKTEKRNSCFGHFKLSDLLPAKTLTANHSLLTHWKECRKLTFREWKRLGSFPDDYKAKTDKIGKYMIGMSVPPKMTYQVAKSVIEQWLR